MNKRMTHAGFTLVELLVVIGIMVVMLAITIPAFNSYTSNQHQNNCLNNLRRIGAALIEYRDDHGVYPAASVFDYLSSEGTAPAFLPFTAPLPVLFDDNAPDGLDVTAQKLAPSVDKDREYRVTITGAGNDQYTWEYREYTVATGQWSTFTTGGTNPIVQNTADPLGDGVELKFAHATYDPATTWTFAVSPVPADVLTWMKPQQNLLNAVNTGDDTLDFTDASGLAVGDTVIVGNTTTGCEVVRISNVLDTQSGPDTLTLATALRDNYPANTVVTKMVYGNLGMAKLYQLYLTDTRDYLKSYRAFHCPAMDATADVDRLANVTAPKPAMAFRNFDPLWSGYNTYDVTYNYEQFDAAIVAFNGTLGETDLHTPRQLKNPDAPPDTVVCWCYGHRAPLFTEWTLQHYADGNVTAGAPALSVIDPDDSAVSDPVQGEQLLKDLLYEMESGGRQHLGENGQWLSQRNITEMTDLGMAPDLDGGMFIGTRADVVLWLDGSVGTQHQQLVRGKDAGNRRQYYWLPPYLAARGEWQQ